MGSKEGDGNCGVEWQQGLLEEAGFIRVVPETEAEGEEEFVVVIRNQKLEEEKKKGLSLDPQRNQNHLLHLHHHHRYLQEEQEQQEHSPEEEQQEEGGQQQLGFYGLPHHFHQQAPNQQQQILYGRGEEGSSLDTQEPPKKRSYFPFTSEEQRPSIEYARFGDKMEDTQHQNQHPPHQTSSRLGMLRSSVGGGEIVEVQGGHIVRSTGRKDRHSKVCTAKGPRDRRVRLSAHTAIQFYDVQDRLGYDRPSKAVDWLIKKAKTAIDELAELPPWRPTATTPSSEQQAQEEEAQNQTQADAYGGGGSSKRPMEVEQEGSGTGYGFQQRQHMSNNPSSSSGFLPPSLDSDAIADTIKSFFPIAATSSSPIHFQSYPPDLLSRTTSSHAQDLRLSLQSFQDPMLLHHQSQHHSNPSPSSQHTQHHALFSGSSPLHYDAASNSWSDQQHPEMGRFQRMIAWSGGTTTDNSTGDGGGGGGGGGFIFNSPPPQQHSLLSQNPFFPQRGPLQSSNSPQFRAWTDPSIAIANHQMQSANQSSTSGIGFASGSFSGFRIPARIQGEEEHDAASNKPPSASRH